jgi:hypothetical protein
MNTNNLQSGQRWRILAAVDGGREIMTAPEYHSMAAALAAMIGAAKRRYAHVECYCGQGEACACGGWIAAPLAFIRNMTEDFDAARTGQLNDCDETISYPHPSVYRTYDGKGYARIGWKAIRVD